MAKGQGKNKYINAKLIEWPPTRDSFKLLCMALNLEISENKVYDAIVYCRGPKLEQEPEDNFSMDKLTQWFLMNLKTFKHINYEFADQDWLEQN